MLLTDCADRGGRAGLASCNPFLNGGGDGLLVILELSLVEEGGVLALVGVTDGFVEDVVERNDSGLGLGTGGTDFADCGVRGVRGGSGGESCNCDSCNALDV